MGYAREPFAQWNAQFNWLRFYARESQPVLFSRCHSSNTFSMWARRCPCCCLLGVCISSLPPPRCKQIGHPQNSPKCIGRRPHLRSKYSSCVLAKRPNHLRRILDPTRVPKSLAPSTGSKRRRWHAGAWLLTAPSPTSRTAHFSLVGDSWDPVLVTSWTAASVWHSDWLLTQRVQPIGRAHA